MGERKRNRLGTISLAVAVGGFLVVELQPWLPLASLSLIGALSVKGLLEAFFEASMAGAVADWFAVSALFKDPLGIPMAHTNILAKSKDVIAEAIPRFLRGFVSSKAITEELQKIDYASRIAEALSGGATREEAHLFLRTSVASFFAAYGGSDAEKAAALRHFVDEFLGFASDRIDASAGASAVIAWLRKERLDQKALEALAEYSRVEIERNRSKLVAIITPMVKRNAGWQGLFIGSSTVERFLTGIMEELAEIKADKTNEFRLFILSSISAYTAKLAKAESAERARLTKAFRDALASDEFRQRFSHFIAGLFACLGDDLAEPDGRLIPSLKRAEEAAAKRLAGDEELRGKLNSIVASVIGGAIERGRLVEGVTEYLAGLLKATDERQFVERVEEAVWNDLQYIRVNGAVVGGLVGLALATFKALLGG